MEMQKRKKTSNYVYTQSIMNVYTSGMAIHNTRLL